VVAAWLLAARQTGSGPRTGSHPPGGEPIPPAHRSLHDSIDRALAQ
jgi:hypothetical protein